MAEAQTIDELVRRYRACFGKEEVTKDEPRRNLFETISGRRNEGEIITPG